ncbi:MAG: SDR family NAD(P)-dependent oxidoreductase [Niabella sp.]
MIRLNLESPVMMVQELLPLLEKNKPAYILNVSSMAGFGPVPLKMVIVPGTASRFTSSTIRALPRRWIAGIYYMLGKE